MIVNLGIQKVITDLVLQIKMSDVFGEKYDSQLSPQTNLIDDLDFSSLDIIALIILIEEEFNITIADDDLTIEKFKTIESITNFLELNKKYSSINNIHSQSEEDFV